MELPNSGRGDCNLNATPNRKESKQNLNSTFSILTLCLQELRGLLKDIGVHENVEREVLRLLGMLIISRSQRIK